MSNRYQKTKKNEQILKKKDCVNHKERLDFFSTANLLTSLRIILIPFFILIFYWPFYGSHVLSALIFGFAAMTDWLDGYIARSFKQTSQWGTFLDPVADKLIVATALVLLTSRQKLPYLTVPAVVMICREIAVSALREWMAQTGKPSNVTVSFLGKLKTAAQMLAIILLLLCKPGHTPTFVILTGYTLLYIAMLLTLWSMCLYLIHAWKKF